MDTAVAVTTFRDEEKLLSPTDLPPPPSSDGNVSAVVQVESENEISNVQLESRQNEQTTVQVTVSFDAPVKDDDKPKVHTAQSESPSVKGGYNLRCQPRSVVRLVDQPARLSMPMKAGKADEKAGRIVRKRFGAKIRDDTKQSRSAVGDGKRKRRTKRSGARSKVQTSSEEKGKRQRKRPGPKKIGRPSGAPRGRPRTRDPYKFNDNASVPTVGRLMHVHPPKRISGCGLQEDIQCLRNVAGEKDIVVNREQTVDEMSVKISRDPSESVHAVGNDEQIRSC